MLTKEEFLKSNGGQLLHKIVENEATFRHVNSKDEILDINYEGNGIINCSLDNMINFCLRAKKELSNYKDVRLVQTFDDDDSIATTITYTREESDGDLLKRQNERYEEYVKLEQRKLDYDNYKKEQEQLAQEYKDKLNTLKRKYGA